MTPIAVNVACHLHAHALCLIENGGAWWIGVCDEWTDLPDGSSEFTVWIGDVGRRVNYPRDLNAFVVLQAQVDKSAGDLIGRRFNTFDDVKAAMDRYFVG